MAAFPMFFPPYPMHPYFNAASGAANPFYHPQYHPGNPAYHAPKPPEQAQETERANTSADGLATMSMKIAELENDLRRCLAEKTKAELVNEDVSRKGEKRSGAVGSSVAKMQVAFLEKELTRTKRINIALKAKLGQTQTLLYKLTSMRISAKDISSFKRGKASDTPAEVSSDEECLIDLLDPNLFPSSTNSREGTTAVEASTEGSDSDEDDSQETEEVVAWPTSTTDSFSSISSSSSYIQHFVKKSQDQSLQQAKEHQNSVVQDTGLHRTASVGNDNPSADAEAAVVDGVPHNSGGFRSRASACSTDSHSHSPSLYSAHNDGDGCVKQSLEIEPGPSQPAPDMGAGDERSHHNTWIEYMQALNNRKQSPNSLLDNRDILRGNLEGIHINSEPNCPQSSPTPNDQGRLSPPDLTRWATALFMKGRSSKQGIRWSSEVGMARHGLRPRCDFYQSNTQCEQAMELHHQVTGIRAGQGRAPYFFKYGIRYIPRPIDVNVFRTVLINGLPDNATALDLLQKVRGGLVLNAQLVQDLTKGKAALITFLNESAATAYAGFAAKHLIKIHGMTIRVRSLSTPTWPTHHSTLELVANAKATRCFEIPNMRKGATLSGAQEVLKFPGMTTNGLEYSRIRNETTLQLRFTSIQYAIQAYEMYYGCTRRWLPDPCAQPVETLLDQDDTKVMDGGSEATNSMGLAMQASEVIKT